MKIKSLSLGHLPEYAEVVRQSFATSARDYCLTRENCPDHWSFITNDKLSNKFTDGYYPFGLFIDNKIIGFVALSDKGEGVYEMNTLSILPEYRHLGYGKTLLDYCKNKCVEFGGNKIVISLADTDNVLKQWYIANGFVHTGTKKFENLPLPVGYMEYIV